MLNFKSLSALFGMEGVFGFAFWIISYIPTVTTTKLNIQKLKKNYLPSFNLYLENYMSISQTFSTFLKIVLLDTFELL